MIHAARESPWHFNGGDGEVAVDVSGNLRTNSWVAIRGAALAGQGIAMIPIVLGGEDAEAGRLTRVLPDYDTGEIAVHAIYPAGRHLSFKVRSFLDFLVKRLHDEPVLLGYGAEAAA